MNINKKVYRVLIVLSFIIDLVAGLVDEIFSSLLPEQISKAIENTENPFFSSEAGLVAIVAFLVPYVLLLISTYVGLFMFKPWSRRLSIYTTIFAIPLAIVVGPTAMSGLSSSLSELSNYMWGSILALTFFSPISNEFRGKSS